MGSVRKASAWLGLVDDSDDDRYYDDDYAEEPETGDAWVTDPRVRVADEAAQPEDSAPTLARSRFCACESGAVAWGPTRARRTGPAGAAGAAAVVDASTTS